MIEGSRTSSGSLEARTSAKTRRIDAVTAERPNSAMSRSASGPRSKRSTEGITARDAIQKDIAYFKPAACELTYTLLVLTDWRCATVPSVLDLFRRRGF